MSGHGTVLSEEMLKALPSRVSKITQGLLLTVGIVSTVVSLAGEYSHGSHYLHSWLVEQVEVMGALLHLVLILLVLFPGRIRRLNDEVRDKDVHRTIDCLNRYAIAAWPWIWVCFGLFYTVIFFDTLHPIEEHEVQFGAAAYRTEMLHVAMKDIFDMGSTYFIGLTFIFLSPGFLRSYDTGVKHRGGHPPVGWVHWRRFWVYTISSVLFAGALLYGRVSLSLDEHAQLNDGRITLLLGLWASMVMAYFAGRMDSKFVIDWKWVIPILFLYAAIQAYGSVLSEPHNEGKAVFTYAAFTMKCVLFLFVSNFFESRKVIYYAQEIVRTTDRTVKSN